MMQFVENVFLLKVKKIHEKAVLPVYGTSEAACADLSCVEDFVITSGETKVIKTGLKVQWIHRDYKLHVYSRSGLAAKNGICVLNAPGVIDSDYRGEIIVPLHNDTNLIQVFSHHDRIAQLIILPYLSIEFNEVSKLSTTNRGEGGFGSTGKE